MFSSGSCALPFEVVNNRHCHSIAECLGELDLGSLQIGCPSDFAISVQKDRVQWVAIILDFAKELDSCTSQSFQGILSWAPAALQLKVTAGMCPGTLSKGLVWPPPSPARLLLVNLGQRTGPAGPGGLLSLEIENLEGSASIVCTEGDKIVWRDHVKAPVLRAAGNIYFSAVALSDGSLIVCLHCMCLDTFQSPFALIGAYLHLYPFHCLPCMTAFCRMRESLPKFSSKTMSLSRGNNQSIPEQGLLPFLLRFLSYQGWCGLLHMTHRSACRCNPQL